METHALSVFNQQAGEHVTVPPGTMPPFHVPHGGLPSPNPPVLGQPGFPTPHTPPWERMGQLTLTAPGEASSSTPSYFPHMVKGVQIWMGLLTWALYTWRQGLLVGG
jgi:hypothetical protein